MYGWIVIAPPDPRRGASHVIDRCEQCGLGVTREAPGDGAILEGDLSRLESGGTAETRAPNRGSWQAGLGGDRWAALELPPPRLHLTVRSVELLLESRGLEARRVRQPAFGRNQVWMWQTLLNGFTFHANFAREALRRRLTPRTARNPVAFAVDALVSVLAALPVALISVPLELVASLLGRGGELVVSVGTPTAPAATEPASRSAS